MYKFLLVLLLFLAGCNTTKQMVIPISSEKPTFSKIKMKENHQTTTTTADDWNTDTGEETIISKMEIRIFS